MHLFDFLDFFENYSLTSIFALVLLSAIAGFIDAIVGGGGLIQIPALLINLPNTPLPTLFGTNKIAALSGTTFSAYQYSKRIKFDYKLLLIITSFAFVSSYFGAKAVSHLPSEKLKPILLGILIVIAIYTFLKKDLGDAYLKLQTKSKQRIYGSLIGILVGFYDGFFGPGTGSFFVLGFVVILGFDFLHASAYSKVINCFTNISALYIFINQGNYIIQISILLAVFNIIGSVIGTKMALNNGNKFIRVIFLIIVCLMIVRYGYDVYISNH
jgi:hypothetical protein